MHFFFTGYLMHCKLVLNFILDLGLRGRTFNLSKVEQRDKDKKLNSDCCIQISVSFFPQ